tara:strand:+ start:1181 stop:2119 length:939 start_codon:yes stop_codon:yes gene_type:complete
MKFLNKKEQVLELQVTQYGKSLLSRGVFKPTYYAFFDDDVTYDSQYMSAGSSQALEHSTDASDRIRDAIRPETQYNYSGVETNIAKLSEVTTDSIELTLEQKLAELSKPPSAIENYYSMGLPMGVSKYNSNNVPAWDLKFSNGEIKGPITDYTGSSGLLKIPQLSVETFYDIYSKEAPATEKEKEEIKQKDNVTVFPDNTYIEIEKGFILVDMSEFNSLFENENFEIEVYEIVEEPDSNQIKETLYPLKFISGEKVDNNVYYSEQTNQNVELTAKNVEFYFDVRVDDEIGDDIGLVNSVSIYKTPENNEEPC